ncbi:phosphate:acyl-[acyl carrier protein] acyltransferase [Scopulibacillus darangshiensis]|uniref:Phosphate acyltransferase n=1 Tax=Scopulibacillus darangshiensis TaxID=442528 RepID=A0A4R2P4Y6_9BACL|nr:phosphate acyltransferase PlsX [Scopulibacillus darangshiensis]TCP29144.1 phosphate:acyl-[acyl carrier protein] acyltransferase [Scopulibacillus darangshiensis]
MKLAIDAMGGDHAPQEIVKGAIQAAKTYSDLKITLVGDQTKIEPMLNSHPQFEILHTTEKIEATDSPVKAVRKKKDASMVLAIHAVKEGRADAAISAGNTGALMAAGLFGVGRIKGIDRPALAPTFPTVKKNEGFLFLDVGSNMDAKPEHLLQYAIMGSIYTEKVLNKPKPRIGLLNVGEEPGKGNELSKAAYSLLKDAPLNFVGNVESRELLQGAADVVVCDGFSGNLVLKAIEGSAMSFFSLIKEELTSSFFSKVLAGLLYPKLKGIKNTMDYAAYGGACLFGLAAPVIKAHGSSNAHATYTTIQQARLLVEKNVVNTIEETILEKRDQWAK